MVMKDHHIAFKLLSGLAPFASREKCWNAGRSSADMTLESSCIMCHGWACCDDTQQAHPLPPPGDDSGSPRLLDRVRSNPSQIFFVGKGALNTPTVASGALPPIVWFGKS